jgi:hypothetical protein
MIARLSKFLIIQQIKAFTKASGIFFNLLYLLISLFYGYLTAVLFDKISEGGTGNLTMEAMENGVFGVLIFFGILRSFFPKYIHILSPFKEYYPVSKIKSYTASILIDLIKPYYFYMSLFLLVCLLISNSINLSFLISGLLCILASHMFTRNIKYLIEFKVSKIIFILNLLLLLASILPLLVLGFENFPLELALIISIIINTASGYHIHKNKQEKRSVGYDNMIKTKNPRIALILKNKKARFATLMALFFKIVFFIIVFIPKGGDSEGFDEVFKTTGIIWLMLTPSFLFSYVFNNMWGFWESIWENVSYRTGDNKMLFKIMFQIMIIPLIIDMIITLPILFYLSPIWFSFLFYLSTTIFSVVSALFWSSYFPKKVNEGFQTKGGSNPLGLIPILIFSITLGFGLQSKWMFLILPIMLITGYYLYLTGINPNPERKYKIREKLRSVD